MERNSLSRRFSATLLIAVVCFIVLFLPMASALDIDNVQSYNPETRTYKIENFFGLGETLAEIKLISELNVFVPRGYQKVAEFELFNFKKDYNDAFKDMNFYQANNLSKELIRTFDYKYLDHEWEEQIIYKTVCTEEDLEKLELYIGENVNCKTEEVDKENILVPVWIKFSDVNELPNNESVTIGIFTDVQVGDRVEWIPIFFGERLTEWAGWTEGLNVDLSSYYKLDEQDVSGSGVIIDSLGANNGTNVGTVNVTGLLGTAYNFTDDNISLPVGAFPSGSADRTISIWVFNDGGRGFGSSDVIIGYGDYAVEEFFGFRVNSDPLLRFVGYGGDHNTNFTMVSDEWVHIVGTYDGTKVEMYANAEVVLSVTQALNTGTDRTGAIGEAGFGVSDWKGVVDEVGVWSRVLSQSEITALYNGGVGITFTELTPVITIIFPKNITYNETLTELNYSVTNGDFCWFSDDAGATNSSSVVAGINFTGLSSISLTNEWTVYCNNSNGIGSESVVFFVNQSSSTELISPIDNSNSTITEITFITNSTPTNTNLSNVTLYIWYVNGTEFLTNTSILSGDIEVQTNFTQNLSDGIFLWNAETCGVFGVCSFASNNRTLEIHSTPSTVVIHFPNETITFLEPGENLTLNWTISEPGQNLSEHIINCSYLYNGVTTELNKSTCIEINETSFLYVDGVNNLSFTVLEEFGLTTTETTTWDFLFEKYNVTFDAETSEGEQNTFRAEVILGGGSSVSEAIFYYNGTNYTTSIIFSSGEYVILSSITVPLVVVDTNFSLGFFIVIEGITYDLATFEQLVTQINMSGCGASNDTLINMSLFNEETKASIVGKIEVNAQAISKTSGETTGSFNITFTNVSSGSICLSPISVYDSLYFSAEIRYSSTPNFVPEFYNIQLADMGDYPRNLSLFDLATNDSTEFSITYQDDTLIPVEGAIVQLQRKYISEDIYEIVEAPLTSNLGTAVVHIDLNTNKYRASIVKDGVLLDFFDNIVFDCENELSGECTQLLLGIIDPQNNIPLIELTDFAYSISAENDTITTIFIIPSGTPANVNVVLTQTDQFGNETACNQSIISSGGSIDCTFSPTIGESFLGLKISKDQELQAQRTYIVVDDTNLDFLGNNFFIVIVILLSLAGMAFSSPEWMIVNAVVVMLIGGAFWLLNGVDFVMGLGSLIWLVIASGILIYKLSKQEDR